MEMLEALTSGEAGDPETKGRQQAPFRFGRALLRLKKNIGDIRRRMAGRCGT